MPSTAALARGAGHRVLDLLALALALPLASFTHGHLFPAVPLQPIDAYGAPLVAVFLLWGAASWLVRVYDPPVPKYSSEKGRLLFSIGLVALGASAAIFFTGAGQIPRALLVLYFGAAAALLLASRWACIAIARNHPGRAARRFAVVGTGGLANEIVEAAAAHPDWNLQFVGFIAADETPARTRGALLGTLSQLGRILEQEVLDEVIFAVPRERIAGMEASVQLCEEQGVSVQISLAALRYGNGRMTVGDYDGMPMLGFTRTPSDAVALATKRIFDVVVSALALILLSPVLAAVAIAIKVESPGPVFFRQRRVGLNGRPFFMVKFRSMHTDAEARLEALRAKNEMSGPVFKITNDPRVTRVGRFIRRASLDELPQFWNVLSGEMSVVGPRPPIPAEVRQYKRWQRRRLSVKPGITCIWQVSGRNEIDFERWMELDLEYIDHWSLWGDVRICLRTIPAVLLARGAR